jgi:integration host factor subunit beta
MRQQGSARPRSSLTEDKQDREMNKTELIRRVAAANPHLTPGDAELVGATIFDVITTALMHGERVELRRFGAFTVRKHDARIGRNPRTGDTVAISEKHVPFFKTGKVLHRRLQSR